MSKFKVGDKCRSLTPAYRYHDVGIIKEIDIVGYILDWQNKENTASFNCHWIDSELELVEEKKCEPRLWCNGDTKLFIDEMVQYQWKPFEDYQNKQTIMSKITTFAKNLVLSADEKLLRKYGLKDECGEFTDEAESLVMAKLVKENQAYLVELATAMQVEEAKK